MKKKLIVGLIIFVAAVITALLVMKPLIQKKDIKKIPPQTRAAKKVAAATAKREIPKDKGSLIVRIVDSKKKEMYFRIKAFRAVNTRSSVYEATFSANRPYLLPPGNYDLEIDTIPPKIHKNVSVARGRERIENLGSITGSVMVKALDARKGQARYPINIMYAKSNIIVTAGITNRPFEIMPGLYDIEIATAPRQFRKGVKVSAGKETVIELGSVAGIILVKAVDESGKGVRSSARLLKSETNEPIAHISTNKPTEVLEGTYNIELASTPRQTRSDIKVSAGQETAVEFTVQGPSPTPPQKAKK